MVWKWDSTSQGAFLVKAVSQVTYKTKYGHGSKHLYTADTYIKVLWSPQNSILSILLVPDFQVQTPLENFSMKLVDLIFKIICRICGCKTKTPGQQRHCCGKGIPDIFITEFCPVWWFIWLAGSEWEPCIYSFLPCLVFHFLGSFDGGKGALSNATSHMFLPQCYLAGWRRLSKHAVSCCARNMVVYETKSSYIMSSW